MLYYSIFFFLAFGAKLLLALVMIYMLLPGDRRCNQCDDETLLLQLSRGRLWLARACLDRLQRRWCPACGWEGYARASRPASRVFAIGASARRRDDAREFLN
jgi:hypothetical protein